MKKPDRKALIEKALALDAARKSARAREEMIAKAQAEARIREYHERYNAYLAFLVDDEGLSVNEISRLMRKNWRTIDDAVKLGRKLRTPKVEVLDDPHMVYDWDGETLTVTASPVALIPFAPMLSTFPTASETWSFTADGGRILPVDANVDATWGNPVVQAVMTEQGKRDALAFIASVKE
ncbi:hypothetical protein [Microbacterium sp.]|uniref:hypothetical protein n=1 Tax=Microbacterium sp. TaxID=51671 RepID=UPI0039E5B17B